MDPNPTNFPILSYVMSKLPSMGPRRAAKFDIEQPPPSPSGASASVEPHFELKERMPHLSDPGVITAMQAAIAEVVQTRSVLGALGERPDHESVDHAKEKLREIEENLSKRLDEIELSPRPADAERVEQEELRKTAEKEMQIYRAVISLDEMHEAYENMLKEAEAKLEKIYETTVARRGETAAEGGEESQPVLDEVHEEVVGILQDASVKEVERINLSGRSLRILPEAFGKIRGLVVLDLSSNQLEVIPDSIGGLERLEELYLSSNNLESFPESIGLLVNLRILNASGNKLTALPDSICNCRSLVELDASFNKLAYLPTNIGHELLNLRKLSIYLNKIRSLPTSIGEMKSLLILDVHFNDLRGLPLAIGKLTNLELLNVSSNFSDLTDLPDTIGDLTNLKELDLSNNQIHELPITFGRLESLTKLNLDQNPLVIPPKEVVDEGVDAIRVFMTKRWLEILAEEEQKSMLEAKEQSQTGLLFRGTAWLSGVVSHLSRAASGYLGSAGSSKESYLDQQL